MIDKLDTILCYTHAERVHHIAYFLAYLFELQQVYSSHMLEPNYIRNVVFFWLVKKFKKEVVV